MKTIFVVFTDRKLSKEDIRRTKKYSFNTTSDLKEGDVIKTKKYTSNLQVVNVLEKAFKYYNSSTGELSDTITSSNQNEIINLELRNDEEETVYGHLVEL